MAKQSDAVRDILLIIAAVLFVSFALGKGDSSDGAGTPIPILTPE